jgi:hypothetical protein
MHEWVVGFEQFWSESFLKLNAYVQQLRERSNTMPEVERESASARELVVPHTIDGPRDLVFEAYSIFKTKEQRAMVVERFHALEAGKQTLSNLAAYVEQLRQQQI